MWAEAELHQGFCFRQPRHREAVIGLVAPHRLTRLIVPAAGRLGVHVARLGQGLLDFLNAFRGGAHPGSPAPLGGGKLGLREVTSGRAARGVRLAGVR